MKKFMFFIAVILITAFLIDNKTIEKENRGVFISYIEYNKYFNKKDKEDIKKEIKTMINNIKNYKLNRIYLQVRAFSDSIYNSSYFPFTHTISSYQGKNINLDVLDYFIKEAKSKDIEIYAWVNPYRISNGTDTSFISKDNPAYKWLNTNKVKVIEEKGIYYNPASKEVKQLIINGIKEIVENYEIDGLIIDDYFYPDNTIDLEEYKEYENVISLSDFRLNNVNELVSSIYKTIKEIDENVKFGISPDANIKNNYEIHYADVKTWLSKEGYIDFIMPQIYYGFLHETKPFIETVNEWNSLIKNDLDLIPALSLYKVGKIDNYAGTGKYEWQENTGIIKKQIQVSRKVSNYDGFSLFRYDFLVNNSEDVNLQKEVNQFLSLF